MWEWIKKIFGAIWEWLINFFNPTKKPIVKITILMLLAVLSIPQPVFAERTDLQSVLVFFYQPHIEDSDFWTIRWHNGAADSANIYKNDSLRVKIRNVQGQWVNWIDLPELDTMQVTITVDRPYNYDVNFTFDIITRDNSGNESTPNNNVRVYFMVSDINKVINLNVDRGFEWGDNSVDGLDLIELAKNWGKTGVGLSEYYDITGDGNVDGLDLIQIAKDWGRTWSP